VRKLSGLKELLWVLGAFGAVAIVVRLIGGLGASTDLSDSMPWGLWKIINMVAGVALATGGFALAATVYIFNLRTYQSVHKPAIVIAFLGYGSSCFCLFLDIGLPHAIWKPIFHWNHHSFLFEVAWCVMLYFSVTALEVAPMVLERFRFPRIVRFFHRVTIPIVIVGITLSTLHHTSLGSLFLVMPARLHALWFTSWLPVLFILSAVGAGIQMVILCSLGYAHFYRRPRNMPVLTGLARGSAVVLGIYLVAKFVDLAVRGQIPTLFSGQWETGFFFAELILGAIIPIVLIARSATRNSVKGLTTASVCAVAGLLLNRANVGITGLVRTAEVPYFPSLTEIALSLGVVAMAGLLFIYMIEHLRIFEDAPATDPATLPVDVREFDNLGRTWAFGLMTARARVSFLVVLALPVAIGTMSGDALYGIDLDESPVRPPLATDEARTVLMLDGNRDHDGVLFKHGEHRKRLGDESSCKRCHHLDLPNDKSSACHACHTDMRQSRSIFDHERHTVRLGDKWSCHECHDGNRPKNLANSKPCHECHEKDMGMKAPETGRFDFRARSYADAMHTLCIGCHREEDHKKGETRRAECAFCHPPGSAAAATGTDGRTADEAGRDRTRKP
jgi:Ni/Fe-hydrogenase subunit HybB-like protein